MAAQRIRWTRRTLRRLDQIGERIARDNPTAAANVAPASNLPYIAYRVNSGVVEVLTILHTAQQWPQEL